VDALVAVDVRGSLARRIELELDRSFSLARAILLDDGEAEDAVQDACLIAWQRAAALRDPDRFGAWFGRILVNGCRDRLRHRQRQRVRAIALQADWREDADGIDPAASTGRSDRDLDAAFDRLDSDHRIVVLLRFWQDLSLDEIADRLDIPVGTVKSRLHYALRTLRTDLEATDGRA
jgi:RNA polymerase sigma-70 factor (ECF subfamily)